MGEVKGYVWIGIFCLTLSSSLIISFIENALSITPHILNFALGSFVIYKVISIVVQIWKQRRFNKTPLGVIFQKKTETTRIKKALDTKQYEIRAEVSGIRKQVKKTKHRLDTLDHTQEKVDSTTSYLIQLNTHRKTLEEKEAEMESVSNKLHAHINGLDTDADLIRFLNKNNYTLLIEEIDETLHEAQMLIRFELQDNWEIDYAVEELIMDASIH